MKRTIPTIASLFFATTLALASFSIGVEPVLAAVPCMGNIPPVEVIMVIDNSGSMNDHRANETLKGKFHDKLKNYFTTLRPNINMGLVFFSDEGSAQTIFRPNDADDRVMSTFSKIKSMSFQYDGSVIASGIKRASDLARERHTANGRRQYIIIAGDEQTGGIAGVVDRLKADRTWPAGPGRGIRYYSVALRPGLGGDETYRRIQRVANGIDENDQSFRRPPGFYKPSWLDQLDVDIREDIEDCTSSLQVVTFHDKNQNKKRDAGEDGLPTTVTVSERNEATQEITERDPQITDANGETVFANFDIRNAYKAVANMPAPGNGWIKTTDDDQFSLPGANPVREIGFYYPESQCLAFGLNPRSANIPQGGSIEVTALMTNRNPSPGKITFNIPSIPGFTYDSSSITPPGSVNVNTTNGLIFTTTNDIPAGESLSVSWIYNVAAGAALGVRNVTATAAATNCPVTVNDQVSYTVITRPRLDLRTTLTISDTKPKPGQEFNFTIRVTDIGPTNGANKPYSVKFTAPKGLTLRISTPATTFAPDPSDPNKIVATWNNTVPVSRDFNFTGTLAATLAPAGSPYSLRACANYSSLSDRSYEVNSTNDCANATFSLDQVLTSKYWTDNQGVEQRIFAPAATANFTVKLDNASGVAQNNLYISDFTSIDCDPTYPQSCQVNAWDSSMAFTSTAGSPRTVNGRLVWGPISLAASGTSKTFTAQLSARVVDGPTLVQKIAQFGPQRRCNNFGISDINGVSQAPTVNVCWTYEVPSDLAVTKTFLDGSQTKQIKRGGAEQYKILVENKGPYAAVGAKLTDTMVENPNPSNGVHFVAWDSRSVENSGGALVDELKAEWPVASTGTTLFNPNATFEVRPKFVVVPCDADVSGTMQVTNLASVSAITKDPVSSNNNNGNSPVVATITDGHYNLALTTQSDRADLIRGDVANDTFILRLNAQNLEDGQVDMAIPLVTIRATIPAEYFEILSGHGGQVDGDEITWEVDSIAKGVSIMKEVRVKVKTSAPAGNYTIASEAVSASANSARTCGYASDLESMTVKLPGLYTVKSISSDASSDVEVGGATKYQLDVTNNSSSTFNGPFKLTDNFAHPVKYSQTVSCAIVPVTGPSSSCTTAATVNGTAVEWPIASVPSNSTIRYIVEAKVDPTFTPPSCPIQVNNLITLKDGNDVTIHESAPTTVNVFASRCFSGNVYAQTSQNVPGVEIRGSDIIIDSQSVIASNKAVDCRSNVSCNSVTYKISNYGVDPSTGSAINYDKLKGRMSRNKSRLDKEATVLPTLNGSFHLQKGFDSAYPTEQDAVASYPEGRVWKTTGNLTISGSEMKFSGKGTILVNGNLTIDSNIVYCVAANSCNVDGSKDNAVGFIVTGNILVKSKVNKIAGAYYAPDGVFTFEGDATTTQLRPAKGLFIAKQFNMQRPKLVILYNSLLNTAQGAPPGFTFSNSPTGTQEGS